MNGIIARDAAVNQMQLPFLVCRHLLGRRGTGVELKCKACLSVVEMQVSFRNVELPIGQVRLFAQALHHPARRIVVREHQFIDFVFGDFRFL